MSESESLLTIEGNQFREMFVDVTSTGIGIALFIADTESLSVATETNSPNDVGYDSMSFTTREAYFVHQRLGELLSSLPGGGIC